MLQRALVLQIRVLRPSVDLRRNRNGAFWELPSQRPGRQPPRVALRIQVPQRGPRGFAQFGWIHGLWAAG